MSDIATIHAAVLTRLRTIPHITVYDGDVAAQPPADPSGAVLPYIVVWGPATDPAGYDLTGKATSGYTATFTVTAVGGTVARCLQAGTLLAAKLNGWTPAFDAGPLAPLIGAPGVQTDRDVTPARHFQPHQYRCTTN